MQDWTRIDRATLEVEQCYRYAYSGPVADVRQRLIVVPPDVHGDQRLVDFQLDVDGAPHATAWETDRFGNRVARVDAPHVQDAIAFQTRFRVRRSAGNGAPMWLDPRLYLEPTPLTPPDPRIRAVAREITRRAPDLVTRAERAFAWSDDAIMYEIGATHVQTTASDALRLGRGVCQDFTHLLLAVLRELQIPARYVSGHLLGEGVPHAWVEALIDDQVVAYDPTHRRRTRLDYITVAVGRDYADVAPTSGVFRGSATGSLNASKTARAVMVTYAPDQALEAIDGEAVA